MPATGPIRWLVALVVALALSACSSTEALRVTSPPTPLVSTPSSEKYAAIVVDANSGKVLYDADAGAPRFPASLTKMMTLYMLFEAMESGRVSLATEIPVSATAARQPPSKIGFRPGETITVDTAIRALTVKSANDVAAAVGEFLGGTEESFAAAMTAKARSIGLRNTVFRNASGLPDPDQKTTARDMAVLGIQLRRRFPVQFAYFGKQVFEIKGRMVKGHNVLVGSVEGVDGIKTGYVRASGFNVVTSVARGGRRLVVVVMGGRTARERNAHVEELIERYLPRSGV